MGNAARTLTLFDFRFMILGSDSCPADFEGRKEEGRTDQGRMERRKEEERGH